MDSGDMINKRCLKKGTIFLRFLLRILISLFTAGWLVPQWISQGALISYLHLVFEQMASPQPFEMVEKEIRIYLGISSNFSFITLVWLGLVVIFWSFVFSAKLWRKH